MSKSTTARSNGYGFRFEKLDVWHAARALNREIYRLSSGFPAKEQFGLTSQIRRAAVSVSSNIAEGSGRNSDKDFAHFLEQAYASLMEVASQLYLALDQEYISTKDAQTVFPSLRKLAAQLAALNRSLEVNDSKVGVRSSGACGLAGGLSTLGPRQSVS